MKKGTWIKFVLIFLGTMLYFMANLQRVAVPGSIFDTLQRDLSATPANITALGASFMYLYAICQVIIGIFISRYGGYRVLSVGAVLFTIGSLLFPFSHTLWLLYISRGLVGLGSATFYLSITHEMKMNLPKKNFSVVLSLGLFIGYLGGIMASAPLVWAINQTGWRTMFIFLGLLTLFIALLFIIFKLILPSTPINKKVKFNFDLYKLALTNKANYYLYTFGCLNYAIYYILQTVLGKKFLEDFNHTPTMTAAIILSVMSSLYAFSGPILASLSKVFSFRKAIFLKIAGVNALVSILLVASCVAFNVQTIFIPIVFCFLAFFACQSPLLIPLAYGISKKNEGSVSISIMTSMFFFIVAVLANVSGFILNSFSKITLPDGTLIYSNQAYLMIFGILLTLSIISLYCALHIKDTKLTRRFIRRKKYLECYSE